MKILDRSLRRLKSNKREVAARKHIMEAQEKCKKYYNQGRSLWPS